MPLRAVVRAWRARAGRAGHASVRVELMAHLGVVMALALVVLVATLAWSHERALQRVIGRALLAEARNPGSLPGRLDPETSWWSVDREGNAIARGGVAGRLDARSRELARVAFREDGAVVDAGAPWDPIRFATPIDAEGRVAVARLPARVSVQMRAWPLAIVGSLVACTLALLGAVGVLLLHTRVVVPLERLAQAARGLGEGGELVTVPLDGPREVSALAHAFNEMSESLLARGKSLEAAVVELREANDQLRRTRAGLARAERLAVVGRLAAGVAHEVGNPMGAVLAFVELAAKDPSVPSASRSHLAKAAAAGERVRQILRQLLDFSRPARPSSEPFDLAEAAQEACDLVSAQQRFRSVRIEVICDAGAGPALGDAAASVQILLNLLLNAADACREQAEPHITVRVRSGALRRRAGDGPAIAGRSHADAIECLVADNGCGIPEEDRERIFDPFFTSKPPGEGTGLGLATALRIAEEMNGVLELAEPPESARTAFSLRLPAAGVRASSTVRRAD